MGNWRIGSSYSKSVVCVWNVSQNRNVFEHNITNLDLIETSVQLRSNVLLDHSDQSVGFHMIACSPMTLRECRMVEIDNAFIKIQ